MMADQELSLLGKVELRLVMTKADDKFLELLKIYLIPILSKLASPHESVREKVKEVCHHINQRIKTPPYNLPVEALLQQYCDAKVVNNRQVVQAFDLVYVQKGLPDLTKEEAYRLLPLFIKCVNETENSLNLAVLLNILVDVLEKWDPPARGTKVADKLREYLEFEQNAKAEEVLKTKLLEFLSAESLERIGVAAYGIMPEATPRFILSKGSGDISGMAESQLFRFKQALMKLVLSGAFSTENTFVCLMAASADRNSIISNSATSFFRAMSQKTNNEVIGELYKYGSWPSGAPKARGKAIQLIARNDVAAVQSPLSLLKVGLNSTQLPILNHSIELLNSVLRLDGSKITDSDAEDFAKALQRTIYGSGWPKLSMRTADTVASRVGAYRALGSLMSRKPFHDLKYLIFLFDALEREDIDMKAAIQEALSYSLSCVDGMTEDQKQKIKNMLLKILLDADFDHSCKFVALRFASKIAPFDDAESRVLCLLGLYHSNRQNVIEEAKRGLNPYWHRLEYGDKKESYSFPDLRTMLSALKALELQLQEKKIADSIMTFSPTFFAGVLDFLEKTIAVAAAGQIPDVLPAIDEKWATNIILKLESDGKVRSAIREYLETSEPADKESFQDLLDYAFKGVQKYGHLDIHQSWVRMLSLSPNAAVESFAGRIDEVLDLFKMRGKHTAQLSAQALGIITSSDAINSQKFEEIVKKINDDSKHAEQLSEETKLVALGFMYSRLALRGKLQATPSDLLASISRSLTDGNSSVKDAAAGAIFQLSLTGAIKDSKSDDSVQELKVALKKLAGAGSTQAVLALGTLASRSDGQAQAIDAILSTSGSKQSEAMFASGEALSIAACGWSSSFTDRFIDVSGAQIDKSNTSALDYALTKALDRSITNNIQERRFVAVWLVALVQYCGHLPTIKQNLNKLHTSFTSLLNNEDTVVQETASKGLSFIYEMGDEKLKLELVRGLVPTTATANTLIAELYRYQFDPNSGVRGSMRAIWNQTVSNRREALDKNFYSILDELLKGMGEREWRVREASALALSELLQSAGVEKYQDRLEDIWKMAFRVIDDIKESVRKAGLELVRGMTSSMVRNVDVESGASEKIAEKILKEMIPFLVGNYGLQSDAEEVSQFALKTLLDLCQKGGKMLKPYIPELIEEFLLLMSTLEPQAMNYLAMNASNYGLTSDEVDASRLSSLKVSPIMDAVEKMIGMLDSTLLQEVAPRIARLPKKAVGLPSKLGVSRVMVILVLRRLQDLEPYAVQLLRSCASQLKNMNQTTRGSYAVSAGYICRVAPTSAITEYAKSIQELYFDTDREELRLTSGIAADAVVKYASDNFEKVASEFLPFIYFGKHDLTESVKKVFDDTWQHNTGGTGAIRLHLQEISALCGEHMNSPKWNLKQTAASTIADASAVVDENVAPAKLQFIFKSLLDACKGKSWKGKELVLEALVKLSNRMKVAVQADKEIFDELNRTVLVEAKRRNKEYQFKALIWLGVFIKAYPQREHYEVLLENSKQYLDPFAQQDEDVDGDITLSNTSQASEKEEARKELLAAVIGSYRGQLIDSTEVPVAVLREIVSVTTAILSSESSPSALLPVTWRTKLQIGKSLTSVAPELNGSTVNEIMPLWKVFYEACLKDRSSEHVRTVAVKAASALFKTGLDIRKDLTLASAEEKSPSVLKLYENIKL